MQPAQRYHTPVAARRRCSDWQRVDPVGKEHDRLLQPKGTYLFVFARAGSVECGNVSKASILIKASGDPLEDRRIAQRHRGKHAVGRDDVGPVMSHAPAFYRMGGIPPQSMQVDEIKVPRIERTLQARCIAEPGRSSRWQGLSRGRRLCHFSLSPLFQASSAKPNTRTVWPRSAMARDRPSTATLTPEARVERPPAIIAMRRGLGITARLVSCVARPCPAQEGRCVSRLDRIGEDPRVGDVANEGRAAGSWQARCPAGRRLRTRLRSRINRSRCLDPRSAPPDRPGRYKNLKAPILTGPRANRLPASAKSKSSSRSQLDRLPVLKPPMSRKALNLVVESPCCTGMDLPSTSDAGVALDGRKRRSGLPSPSTNQASHIPTSAFGFWSQKARRR